MTAWSWRAIVLAVILLAAAGSWTIWRAQSCPTGHYCTVVVCPDGYRCVTHQQLGQSVLVEKSIMIAPPTGTLGIKGKK
jgi:hypothetical protein